MRYAILAVALIALGGVSCVEPRVEPSAENCAADPTGPAPAAVGCKIVGDHVCLRGGRPRILVELINQTDSDIYLVGGLDGSFPKRRYPHCTFEVIAPDGKPDPYQDGVYCPSFNPLTIKDLFKVPPKGTFNPHRAWGTDVIIPPLVPSDFRKVGAYRLTFVYSTASEDPGAWLANRSEKELIALWARVPKLEVRSEEFVVSVFEIEK